MSAVCQHCGCVKRFWHNPKIVIPLCATGLLLALFNACTYSAPKILDYLRQRDLEKAQQKAKETELDAWNQFDEAAARKRLLEHLDALIQTSAAWDYSGPPTLFSYDNGQFVLKGRIELRTRRGVGYREYCARFSPSGNLVSFQAHD